jgi:YidC/Oxa1 family membrane protein insertase
MTLWTMWLDTLRGLLEALSSEASLGLGLAIIAGTILLRSALLPISWSVGYHACIRQKKMTKLQPELQALKEQHADKPDVYMQKLMALYRKHNLSFVDGKSLFGALAQMPLFLGMFQVLRHMGDGVQFLWIKNPLRPDFFLALIAGVTTAFMMMANPDLPEQMRMFMIIAPSIIAIIAALNFCSALAIYWATSNCFSAIQTVVLHFVVDRRVRAGTLRI